MAQNVGSPAKKQSDVIVSHAKLISLKADLVEIQRLGTQVLTVNPVTDAQIAAIETQILEARALLKYND